MPIYIWLTTRSTENQHVYDKHHQITINDTKNEALNIKQSSDVPGQIWKKMNKDDFSEQILGGISEKVNTLSLDSASIYGSLEQIKKELSEWRNSKSSPIRYHQDAITEKFEDLERNLKKHFRNVEEEDKQTYLTLKSINDELANIRREVERPRILIPILLTGILIVLLIK